MPFNTPVRSKSVDSSTVISEQPNYTVIRSKTCIDTEGHAAHRRMGKQIYVYIYIYILIVFVEHVLYCNQSQQKRC